MFTALSLLLLHSFVPHQHHDELSDAQDLTEHSSADSSLDFLGLIFHENLGEHHLENFENTECHFNFVSTPIILVSYPSFNEESEEVQNCYLANPQEVIPLSVYQKTTSKRGPPTA